MPDVGFTLTLAELPANMSDGDVMSTLWIIALLTFGIAGFLGVWCRNDTVVNNLSLSWPDVRASRDLRRLALYRWGREDVVFPRPQGKFGTATAPAQMASCVIVDRSVSLDAVVVPASRGADAVERAAVTAGNAGVPLVVLASRKTAAPDVDRFLSTRDMPTTNWLVVDVETVVSKWCEPLETMRNRMADRANDVAMKRNIGVALARVMDWSGILFVDDDVQAMSSEDIKTTSDLLAGSDRGGEGRGLVGWSFDEFRDSSVVGHALSARMAVGVGFPCGGAMAVECRERSPFFPSVYNEDLLFALQSLREDRWDSCLAGSLRQDPYGPFDGPERASSQEFGEVLVEGWYCLLSDPTSCAAVEDTEFWKLVLAGRRAVLEAIASSLVSSGAENAKQCVLSALARHGEDWPHLLAAYAVAWHRDMSTWRSMLATLPRAATLDEAVVVLELGPTS